MKTMDDGRAPEIIVRHHDHDRLAVLADAALDTLPDLAETLLFELDRAKLVADERFPATIVRMGSEVEYEAADGRRRVRLVYPEDADIATGRISVLTPVGIALIGLSAGQSIRWTKRDGRVETLTVLSVDPPADGEE